MYLVSFKLVKKINDQYHQVSEPLSLRVVLNLFLGLKYESGAHDRPPARPLPW